LSYKNSARPAALTIRPDFVAAAFAMQVDSPPSSDANPKRVSRPIAVASAHLNLLFRCVTQVGNLYPLVVVSTSERNATS
jgi:hypothetical protein